MTIEKKILKVAVTGTAGQIGYALLFRIISGEMFGKNYKIDLRLIDLPEMLAAVEGVAMELHDCASPFLSKITVTSDLKIAFDGINFAILVGARPRTAGMERSDLLNLNAKIFIEQGSALNHFAASNIKVLVVGNPCNTNCYIAMQSAPDINKNQFYAMTMLDQQRAVSFLADKANIAIETINNLIIWGNHSNTQFPDFYHATINNQSVLEYIDEQWLLNDFIELVRKRGAKVIEVRQKSSAASAADAIVKTIYNLTTDSEKDSYYSVAQCSEGQYNIEPGLIYSFPAQTINNKIKIIENLEHSETARQFLRNSANELKQERDFVKSLLLNI